MNFHTEKTDEGVLSLISAIVVSAGTWLWLTPTVLVSYWKWFIVPLGVVPIGHWHAFALLTMVYLFTHHLYREKPQSKFTLFTQAAVIATYLLIAWFIGYLCS
jgi:hypothetical protein